MLPAFDRVKFIFISLVGDNDSDVSFGIDAATGKVDEDGDDNRNGGGVDGDVGSRTGISGDDAESGEGDGVNPLVMKNCDGGDDGDSDGEGDDVNDGFGSIGVDLAVDTKCCCCSICDCVGV